jgi:hypothetical protein
LSKITLQVLPSVLASRVFEGELSSGRSEQPVKGSYEGNVVITRSISNHHFCTTKELLDSVTKISLTAVVMVHVEFVMLAFSGSFHSAGICTELVAFTAENFWSEHGESVAKADERNEAESIASNAQDLKQVAMSGSDSRTYWRLWS